MSIKVMRTTAREFVRHVLFRLRFQGLIHLLRRVRTGAQSTYLAEGSLKSRFSLIYETGAWQCGAKNAPRSGLGSSLAATSILRDTLPTLLDELATKTLLDIGCGDFTWMRHITLRQRYIGVDIVESVIQANRQQFEDEDRSFVLLDAISEELPEADVVLCREVLFHLSFRDIRMLLKNVLSKPRSYFIATSDRQVIGCTSS